MNTLQLPAKVAVAVIESLLGRHFFLWSHLVERTCSQSEETSLPQTSCNRELQSGITHVVSAMSLIALSFYHLYPFGRTLYKNKKRFNVVGFHLNIVKTKSPRDG